MSVVYQLMLTVMTAAHWGITPTINSRDRKQNIYRNLTSITYTKIGDDTYTF
jgi:hypothetical protein